MNEKDLAPDFVVTELIKTPERTPTMGNLAKLSYTHDAMIDLLVAHPEMSQNALAAQFGYSAGWVSNIMASDAFQARLAARREELVDPTVTATLEERFRGITLLSLTRLQEKLEKPTVSDNVVLKAVELGAKSLGVGGNAPLSSNATDHLAILATRLIDLQAGIRKQVTQGVVYENEATAS